MTPSIKKKFVYYDEAGKRHQRELSQELYLKLVKLFDGRPKLVARSSGGLGLAIPCGIKFEEVASDKGREKVFIQVNCKEFDVGQRLASLAVRNKTKWLPLGMVYECFPYTLGASQSFMVDLGGLIPIYVFDFRRAQNGVDMAIFATYHSVSQITSGPAAGAALQLYQIPKDCLRWAKTAPSLPKNERETACRNNAKGLTSHGPSVPERLKLGLPIALPAQQITLEALSSLVEATSKNQTLQRSKRIEMSSEGLLPFGLLEMTASIIR